MQSHDQLVKKLMARPGERAEVDRLEREPRLNDTRITESSGNVFVDLGFDEAEAKVMALRVELIVQLRETLNQQGLTQAETAKQLGVTQPRVSALLKGTWKDFSIDMLLTFAARLGLRPRLTYANA